MAVNQPTVYLCSQKLASTAHIAIFHSHLEKVEIFVSSNSMTNKLQKTSGIELV